MKSDNRIKDFIKKLNSPKIILLLGLGLLLIFLSGAWTESEDRSVSASVTDESRLCELISSVEGVGRCQVALTYGEEGEIVSAAVLCDGANSIKVRSEVYHLIGSLYGIGYNRISVFKISK